MRIKSVVMAVGFALASSQASATTYTYTGTPTFGTGSYVTATAELNCAGSCGAGYFVYPSSTTFFSLIIHSSSNSLLETLSSAAPAVTFDGYLDHLTLNA